MTVSEGNLIKKLSSNEAPEDLMVRVKKIRIYNPKEGYLFEWFYHFKYIWSVG